MKPCTAAICIRKNAFTTDLGTATSGFTIYRPSTSFRQTWVCLTVRCFTTFTDSVSVSHVNFGINREMLYSRAVLCTLASRQLGHMERLNKLKNLFYFSKHFTTLLQKYQFLYKNSKNKPLVYWPNFSTFFRIWTRNVSKT